MLKKVIFKIFIFLLLISCYSANAAYILIPMDNTQKNHLKAYGIAYWTLKQDVEVSWLLNYRGGSFMFQHHALLEKECVIRGVSIEVIADVQAMSIRNEISSPELNMDDIKLQKAPKIAVYAPPNHLPWDDAVVMALNYAEIPFDYLYDEEVLEGKLPMYDWLHLHHEDFTGQYGKFWANYRNAPWYVKDVRMTEERAKKFGYNKVSKFKLAVVIKIKEFVAGGGYLFAMCSAPDSFDVALAAEATDICDVMFDGDPIASDAQEKLNYDNCLAFTNFTIVTNPYQYEISSIDATTTRKVKVTEDFFTLFDFSAKWDPVPTMLCQNHERIIKGFMGQSTAFKKEQVKSHVLILGENKSVNEVRYIHGEFGNGTWTFLGGHDPEDYQHFVNDPPPDLNLYPN